MPPWQVGAGQLPQEPPQPSSPQFLPWHCGWQGMHVWTQNVARHVPLTQAYLMPLLN
jgi:hypothetical protein